jgi:hypothetical protein
MGDLILEKTYGREYKQRAISTHLSRSGIAVVRIWQFDDNCILQVLALEETASRDRCLLFSG